MGELLASAALVLYSINVILTRIGTQRISTNLGYELSTLVVIAFGTLLFIGELLLSSTPLVWDRRALIAFVLAGVFTTFLGRWLSFESITRFGPARASIFQLCVPLFTVAIAWTFLDERLSTVTLLGIPVTLGGLFVVVYVPGALKLHQEPVDALQTRGMRRSAALRRIATSSAAMGLGCACAYAIGNALRAQAMRSWNEPIVGGLVGAVSGLILYMLLTPGQRNLRSRFKGADPVGVWTFVVMGILNISAQILSIMSLRYIPASINSLIVSCIPVLVIPMSYFLLKSKEGISTKTIAGTALTLAGIALILLGRA